MIEDDDSFLVTSRLEIRALLRAMLEQGSMIRMHTKGRELALVTTLLEIEDDSQSIIVDNSADDNFNRRLTHAESVSFETILDKIHVMFTSTQAQYCVQDNRPALRLPFPESLRRVQRREFYRVDIPVTIPTLCTLVGPDRSNVTLAAKDIGAGGIALFDEGRILDSTPGVIYQDCQLDLPEVGVVRTDLQVKRSRDEVLSNGKSVRIVGCQFVNLPNPMHILVQNYIGRLERKLSAKRRGFE